MKKTVFDFERYKPYLLERLDGSAGVGKGGRSRLCEAMGCQSAYLSQVLNGSAHLSLEQAEAAGRFFAHDEDAAEYFLLLVQLDRAGTPALRKIWQRQLERLRARRTRLKDRLHIPTALTAEQQARYYSAWYYAAIHILITAPDFCTPAAIARRLELEGEVVRRALDFLESAGLVRATNRGYETTQQRIHLGDDSDWVSGYHAHWRVRALRALERQDRSELHYSSVVTVSREDYGRLREAFLRAIEEAKTTIRASPAEDAYGFLLDWFPL